LQFADDACRADRDIVQAGFRIGFSKGGASYETFRHAHESLQREKTFIIRIFNRYHMRCAHIMPYVSPALLSDEHFLSACPGALSYSPDPSLKANRPFMKELIRRCPPSLQYADEGLRTDAGFVLASVCQNVRAVRALKHAATHLLSDQIFMLDTVKFCGRAMKYADAGLREDVNFVMSAVSVNPFALPYCIEYMRFDAKVLGVLGVAVARDCSVIKAMHPSQRSDDKIMLEMIRQSPQALGFVFPPLNQDKCFMSKARQLRRKR